MDGDGGAKISLSISWPSPSEYWLILAATVPMALARVEHRRQLRLYPLLPTLYRAYVVIPDVQACPLQGCSAADSMMRRPASSRAYSFHPTLQSSTLHALELMCLAQGM